MPEFLTIIYTILFFFGVYFLLLFILLYIKNKKTLYDYPKTENYPYASLIIPAYNEEESIESTLRNLVHIDYPKEKKEIIVVNDGSIDKTVDIVKKLMIEYPEIRLLDKQNTGKGDSLNKAIEIAKGELIAIVDADSYPSKDCLKKTIGYFEQDEKVAAVTSRVLVKNRKSFLGHFQALDYAIIAWSRKLLDYIDSVYVTNGPFSVYRKKIVEEVGGFDPKNMTEDIEITWNFLSKGYKTKMSYSTEVYTIVPKKLKQWTNQRIRWNLGGIQTINKYKKYFLKGENLFGYFVITYVSLSFLLALVGLFLLLRLILLKLSFYLTFFPFIFQGYNPFEFMEFNFPFSFLLILGMIFFSLALLYYKLALRDVQFKRKGILSIFFYIVLRSLYITPLILSLYRLVKGDIRWYTK